MQGWMLLTVHQQTGYGCRIIAAFLIVTAFWSGWATHSEFSQKGRRGADCRTEAKKGPSSCNSLQSCHCCSCLFLFSLTPKRGFLFVLYSTATCTSLRSGFSSTLRAVSVALQPSSVLSCSVHRWMQMDTKLQTRQPHRNFSIHSCESELLIIYSLWATYIPSV